MGFFRRETRLGRSGASRWVGAGVPGFGWEWDEGRVPRRARKRDCAAWASRYMGSFRRDSGLGRQGASGWVRAGCPGFGFDREAGRVPRRARRRGCAASASGRMRFFRPETRSCRLGTRGWVPSFDFDRKKDGVPRASQRRARPTWASRRKGSCWPFPRRRGHRPRSRASVSFVVLRLSPC